MSVATTAALVHIILVREVVISPRFTQLPPALPKTVPSARVSDLKPANGFPFRAGVPTTVTSSPILSAVGPTLVIPCEASAVAEPVVKVQSVIVPSAFFTVTTIDPCGFTNCSLASAPVTFTSLAGSRSEEHTSELQSRLHLVCRLLLEKKKKT